MRAPFVFVLLCILGLNIYSQTSTVSISGRVKDQSTNVALPFVSVVVNTEKDSVFITGTISNEEGMFVLQNLKPGNYVLKTSYAGYVSAQQPLYVGSLSASLDIGTIGLEKNATTLQEVSVVSNQDEVNSKMDKKTFSVEENTSQAGGSVLQALQNLPGVSVQNGKVLVRGNDKVAILMDGKQTALTGFGNQYGLDNIPASSIDKIEIIHNPSSKYDANGNAGIINIIMKKDQQDGFNGKAGLAGGLGALWIKKKNLPTIRPQYQATPKINPSLSLNYRKKNVNFFLQSDYLYTETLNKNEFVTRKYTDNTIIYQQTKRNRNTHFFNSKAGVDWSITERDMLTVSGLVGTEKIIDHGDEPFFNSDLTERLRLWQFLEDELKTTAMGMTTYQHKFKQAGHVFNAGVNYTFHRENEKYFFDNILPSYTGHDAFRVLSDEQVIDINLDYIKPLKYGHLETGLKFRKRDIPTDMLFIPGLYSPLDTNAGGWAVYKELIPALYGNYVYESKKIEAEIGLRAEYVNLRYEVNPSHITYKSGGYSYIQPFPTLRLGYKLNERNKLAFFYNRRVDRPNEGDIRIFPKYDDVEIIKVGNPNLKPQFTNSLELGYKSAWNKGYFYASFYYRITDGTITRISTSLPGSTLIYAVFQNTGKSYNTGIETVLSHDVVRYYSFNLNLTVYHNQINAFSVENLYPVPNTFSDTRQEMYSGNIKLNQLLHLQKHLDVQLSAVYLAPDLIPQGKTGSRFSLDLGVRKKIQKGKGELFVNATDLLNTMNTYKEITGNNFTYTSTNYYETQVVRIGYTYNF